MGLAQGVVDPGKSDGWREDSFQDIKVEAKLGDIIFSSKVLASAGRKFKMTDDLVVTSSGALDLAQVKFLDGEGQEQVRRSDLQFVDGRRFNGPVKRTITSSFSTAFTSKKGIESSSSHEQSWTAGGKFGGNLGKKDAGGASAELSLQFQDKVVNSLRSSHEATINTAWNQSISDVMEFKEGKFYSIEIAWLLTLDRGNAAYFGERSSFSVVQAAEMELLKLEAYNSPEEMPADYLKKWNELPASGKAKAAQPSA
ncbi:MAG: hypothetical protein ACR2JE_09095 [Acidobacteriaceae bacterium]